MKKWTMVLGPVWKDTTLNERAARHPCWLMNNQDVIWVNYNDLTGIMVNKGNLPQMALIQVGELL